MRSLSVLFITMIFIQTPCFAQGEWPMAGHDRSQSNWAKEEQMLAPPFEMTVIPCPSPIAELKNPYSPYLIYGNPGILFLAIDHTPNILFHLDLSTGQSDWSSTVNGSCCAAGNSPAISGDVVVFGGHSVTAFLTGFNRYTGATIWENNVGSMYGRNVVVDDDRVFVRTKSMFCFDATTGNDIWTIPFGSETNIGWPAIDDSRVYYTCYDTLYAVYKSSGAFVWSSPGAGHRGICVDESQVYYDREEFIYAADKYTGALAWTHEIPDNGEVAFINGNSIAIDDTHLFYVVSANKNGNAAITMLDKMTGTFQWTHEFPGEGTFAPTIANGIVYVVNWESRTLWGLDADSGTVVFSDQSRPYWAQPIVANGALYVNSPNPDSTGYSVVRFTNKPSAVSQPRRSDIVSLEIFPNPANATCTVEYTTDTASPVWLDVVSLQGPIVYSYSSAQEPAGLHTTRVPLNDIPAGMYIVRIRTRNATNTLPLLKYNDAATVPTER